MNDPLVSIVIPVYNGALYLGEAIESALNQTYGNIEVLVVNDGSTDRSEEIARSYGARVRYFEKENGGVSTALNRGIQEMRGTYFSWLSHDDLYYPGKVEKEIAAIRKRGDPTAVAFSNWDVLEMPTRRLSKTLSARQLYGDYCERGRFPVLFNLIHGCSVLIHRDCFTHVGFFDENLRTSQDYDFWFRLLKHYKPLYIDEALIISRSHERQGCRTDRTFRDSCQTLQLEMLDAVSKEEIEEQLGNERRFLLEQFDLCLRNGWDRCLRPIYERYRQCAGPDPKTTLQPAASREVYLYGAGRNGKRIAARCLTKSVAVKALIDRNQDLWGQEIEGCPCIPLDGAPQQAEIWVSIEHGEAIFQDLCQKGYSNVLTYPTVMYELFLAEPDDIRAEQYMAYFFLRKQKMIIENSH